MASGKQGQCHLPYMSTYRDIQAVQRMARTFNPKTEMGGLQANLSTVHERIVAERDAHGPFRDLRDLVRRTGVTEVQLEALSTDG